MDDVVVRVWLDLIGRLHGPFSFRFVLQPATAAICAAHDGLSDAREGRPPYFWAIFTRSSERLTLLRDGWRHERRVILLGVVMDILYQLIVFRSLHVFELAVVVLALAFVPYMLLRGAVNRIARMWAVRRTRVG
jgi:hypothetical protein